MGLPILQRKPDSGLGNIRSSPADPSRNIDWILMAGLVLLTTAGCFIVYSATRTLPGIDPYTYVTRQVIFAIIAAVVMFLVMTLDYEWLHEHWRPLYFFTVVSLMLLLILGRMSGNTMISFDFGPINLQPAEFAKVTVLLAIASFVADEEAERVSYARFLGTLIIVAVPTVLVLAQPDLGGATVLLSCAMGILLVAGAKVRYILAISALTVVTLGAAYVSGFVKDYQLDRIRVFFDEDNPELQDLVFQVRNATRAAGTGGWFGKGWLQGDLINGRDVPVVWADFPMAAVGEQFGLVGCAVLLSLFALVLFRIWRIAGLSKDMLGTYLCAGAFTMLLWQLFQNVAMTIGIMPVTGLPMPFISYGGSGLISFFAIFGLVQSVHMRRMR